VDFPIRPGETLFKFVYHLPYSGPTTLQVKLPYPIRNFAVMHPPSMSFKPSSSQAFTSPGLAQGLRVEQAVSKPVVRGVPEFEVSGIGLAPPNQAAKSSSASGPSAGAASSNPGTPSAGALPAVLGRVENGVWIFLSGFAALFTAIASAVWRKRKRTV
jgi:hypothetical protein